MAPHTIGARTAARRAVPDRRRVSVCYDGRMRWGAATAILVGCASARPAPVETAQVATPPAPPAPAEPPPSTLYSLDDALRDATSSPLDVVGVGGWPGTFRRLACIYRNQRVFVIDEKCSKPDEPNGVIVHVLSPTRGRVTIFAEARHAISRARRADYTAISVGSKGARPQPASLALTMSYEDVYAYETDPMRGGPGSCTAGTQRPDGWCSPGLAITASEYVAQTAAFVREPPDAWYQLVQALMPLRAQAHAAIRPASLSRERLAAWGASWARDRGVDVDEDNVPRTGNPDGLSAAIAIAHDGGALIAGTTVQGGVTVPALARADAVGHERWMKPLPQRGFKTHEGSAVLATPDGAIVLAQGYPNPAWKSVYRVIRLDDRGAVRWEWAGHGKDKHKVPQIVVARLTPQGNVLLHGYIQLVADGDVHAWLAELDGGTGALVREVVGRVLGDHAASCNDRPLDCL